MIDLVVLSIWAATYIAILVWSVRSRHLILGAIALFGFALAPAFYGRATTPDEWHDYPLMGFYYLPTMLAILGAVAVLLVGFSRTVRNAVNSSRGAKS